MNQPITVKRLNLLVKLDRTGLVKRYTREEWRHIDDDQIESMLNDDLRDHHPRTTNSRREIK